MAARADSGAGRLWLRVVFSACLVQIAALPAWAGDYPIVPVPFTDVRVEDEFWRPRLQTNREVTIPYAFRLSEETGRIDNFARAGGLMEGDFVGIYFNDSDVFKVIEGAAYTLATHPDPELEAYLDALIARIAAAQEEDGYLYTARTIDPDKAPAGSGPTRWSRLVQSHELYNVGHMYEAAVAHFQATGKRSLLEVALRNADLIDRTFGPDKLRDVPGHQEIELALVKLFRLTGEERYLRLARFFLDERGRPHGRDLYGPMLQDHKPVIEQDEPVGHAVRAGYMYAGMADVAALTGDKDYLAALDRLWERMVSARMYITGGIGSTRHGEAFGKDYELPNHTSYAETCAAIANALWNHRMFLLHGDGKYIDVLERVIYNGFLAGVSLSGDRFFYVNPLASDGAVERQPWFGCACCPVNVVRFVPSIAGYVYAVASTAGESSAAGASTPRPKVARLGQPEPEAADAGDQERSSRSPLHRFAPDVYVNLFVGGTATVRAGEQELRFTQQTRYPWDGRVHISVEPAQPLGFTLNVRIPGWARGEPVPGDLYYYVSSPDETPTEAAALKVNGELVPLRIEHGYAQLRRLWRPGDTVELDLPMPIRRIAAHHLVENNNGRIALQRGPVVYCLEAADNGGNVRHLAVQPNTQLIAEHQPDLLGGVTVIRATGQSVIFTDGGRSLRLEPKPILAIPYYAWNHRGAGAMAVWIPQDAGLAQPLPVPTIASTSQASASHVGPHDTLAALNDLADPEIAAGQPIPRFTWWDRKGSTEWVQYDFDQPHTIASSEVYWFDDSAAGGGCRLPASWRLLYLTQQGWQEVSNTSRYWTLKDRYSRVAFQPVETEALRLEVQLQPEASAGILEWRVHPAE